MNGKEREKREEFSSRMLGAVKAAMEVVYEAQDYLLERKSKRSRGKTDGTIVTVTDKKSEATALMCLRGLSVHAEERGKVDIDEQYVILVDPLDGTRPFVNGAPTSTVIVALYDKIKHQVVECMVGEPAFCRTWITSKKQSLIFRIRYVDDLETAPIFTPIHVWQGELSLKTTVFLDFYPGFSRKDCQVFTNEEQAKLFTSIFGTISAISMMGSNGLHHALVAAGGEGVAGAITTALGGPWDVAPVLLVLKAGGAARAFTRQDGTWFEKDPLDVMSYHFLVTGNSQKTVDRLSEILTSL